MIDYVQRLQLALSDLARRVGLKAVAGVVIAVGAGFLLAALWSFLAIQLGWGPTYASLAIGAGFVAIAAILLILSSRKKYEMPTTDDLKREVEARLALAADAAAERAKAEALRVLDMAETKALAVVENASYRALKLADDAERRVQGFVHDTARAVGLGPKALRRNPRGVPPTESGSGVSQPGDVDRTGATRQANPSDGRSPAATSSTSAMVVGALALGLTLAARRRRNRPLRRDDDITL